MFRKSKYTNTKKKKIVEFYDFVSEYWTGMNRISGTAYDT